MRRVSDLRIGGEELNLDGFYTLAMVDYLFTGGNGYTMFEDAEITSETMLADNEVAMKYIEEDLKGIIPTYYENPQGRIRIS